MMFCFLYCTSIISICEVKNQESESQIHTLRFFMLANLLFGCPSLVLFMEGIPSRCMTENNWMGWQHQLLCFVRGLQIDLDPMSSYAIQL